MRKNVGTLDATLRLTLGLLGLAYSVGRMSRRPYRTPWILMFLSGMKVAEGITRFCPMLYSMGISTKKEDIVNKVLEKTLRRSFNGDDSAKNAASGKAAKASKQAVSGEHSGAGNHRVARKAGEANRHTDSEQLLTETELLNSVYE